MRRSCARLASHARMSSDALCVISLLDGYAVNAKLTHSRNEGKFVAAQAAIANPPAMEQRAAVLLPLPLPHAYDYRLPAGMVPKRGLLVRAPLGARSRIGVVW